jgi:hypothetical protein
MDSIRPGFRRRPRRVPEPRAERDALAGRPRLLALAALAQVAGGGIACGAALAVARLAATPVPLVAVAACAGAAAAAFGARLGLPRWWRVIHGALPPAAWAALTLDIGPAWYLGAFALTLLVFGAAAGGAVPLYLSSRHDIAALCDLIPDGAPVRVLDAGCGVGSVLAGVRARRPRAVLEGLECSLLPWLAAWLRAGGRRRGWRVQWGSFWRRDLSRYDLVYVFLSPAPMARVWDKARREMRPGTLLVSNRFVVPGVAPLRTVAGCLHVWRM